MIESILALDLGPVNWMLVILCGMFIGMSKTGFSAVGMLVVPVLAVIFGGKPSTGLLLPMLIFADVFAVVYYSRHADWKYLFKLIPWAVAGVLIGVIVGANISEKWFKYIIGILIISSLPIMIWRDMKKDLSIPNSWWLAAVFGLLGGFSSMIGNAAGSIMALYLLSMNLPKNNFIGTQAWFFFMINLFKLPFHIFVWKTISLQSVSVNVAMVPAIITGVFLGIKIVKLLNENIYRWMVIISVFVSSLLLFR